MVVAPRGWFDAGAIRAFLARGDQGVNYARGTWHHFHLALGAVGDFLVIDRSGPSSEKPSDNRTEVSVEEFTITIEEPHGA